MIARLFVIASILSIASGCASVPPDAGMITPGIWFDIVPRAPRIAARPVNQATLDLTKSYEAWRTKLYDDPARHCTIGYGHLVHLGLCDGRAAEAEFLRGIDAGHGEQLLAQDMRRAENDVASLVTVELNDSQYGALCDFVFNVGGDKFATSTLLVAVNGRDNPDIARQFARWTHANGVELGGLKRRRAAEVAMFFQGAALPRAPELPPAAAIDILQGERR